jgi:hypothetical protein
MMLPDDIYTSGAVDGNGDEGRGEQLPQLVKRAAYGGEQITFGPNRGDDVMLIATEKVRRLETALRDLEQRIAELNRAEGEPAPFADLQRELRSGGLCVRGESPRLRRLLPESALESSVPREERIRLGARDDRAPEFRRTRPRLSRARDRVRGRSPGGRDVQRRTHWI